MKVAKFLILYFCCCSASLAAPVSVEKKAVVENIKAEMDEGLGLTVEQKATIKALREEYKAKQQAIKIDLNAKHEALRRELDADSPVRTNVEGIVSEIKALQGLLMDNRVDIVFRLREIYTPTQMKMIKERIERRQKDASNQQQKKNVEKKTKKQFFKK